MTIVAEPLEVRGIGHRYGEVVALRGVSLTVASGEFLTMLGPSGCGKTTLLRIIAGFEHASEGSIVLGGRDISSVAAHRRPVNTVFQRATMFPHLNVFENVAFGLKLEHASRHEIATRVRSALALVQLEGFENRKSTQLSGGQMQRVALARALVKRPKVLLLDEPLASLDLKIRLEMEVELRRVHREAGGTFIYVTHDQREALALGDRTAVMRGGRIEQVGTPREIYDAPTTSFVAGFVGDSNVIPVDVVQIGSEATLSVLGKTLTSAEPPPRVGPAWLIVRPDLVRVTPIADGAIQGLPGTVRDVGFRGTGFTYRVAVPGLEQLVKAEVARRSGLPIEVGTDVTVSWDPGASQLLPRESVPADDASATTSNGREVAATRDPRLSAREGPARG